LDEIHDGVRNDWTAGGVAIAHSRTDTSSSGSFSRVSSTDVGMPPIDGRSIGERMGRLVEDTLPH
jgi:hypothetical protein